MNDEIVKQAACFIKGGSALSQAEREEAARAILSLYPSRDIAVSVVDAVHGYTCEFSHDPAYHASQYDTAEQVIEDALGRGPVQYLIGDQTAERVFKAAGLVNMSDLQAVMDAVERALTPKPLEWKRGVYVSSAKSIGDNSFTVQMINRGDQGHVLYHFFNGEQNKTYHPSRDEAEAAAQLIHNAELAKYLSD